MAKPGNREKKERQTVTKRDVHALQPTKVHGPSSLCGNCKPNRTTHIHPRWSPSKRQLSPFMEGNECPSSACMTAEWGLAFMWYSISEVTQICTLLIVLINLKAWENLKSMTRVWDSQIYPPQASHLC